jgi:hypothetical protein
MSPEPSQTDVGEKPGRVCEPYALYESERELARQAEAAYRRLVSDWRACGRPKAGAGATPGRASSGPSKGKAARQTP